MLRVERDMRLLNQPSISETLDLPESDIILFQCFFTPEESDKLFQDLIDQTHWKQEFMTFYGKKVALPRLTAWQGQRSHSYSGIHMEAQPWSTAILQIKEQIEPISKVRYNSVLLNFYRTGADSVSWHQDDEPAFGHKPIIGSVSLGSSRRFQLRHKNRKDLKTVSLDLHHGSFLLMRGETQHFWRHQIPKTSKPVGPRINLTFRIVQ